jgi:methylated-DNA-[protein]-cysteine S-methyltransferase
MTHFFDTFSTPLGLFSAAVNEAGAVTATAFGNEAALVSRLKEKPSLIRVPSAAATVRAQLLAYFAGELRDFTLDVAPAGTAFQQQVWAALRKIPSGSVQTYGQIAAQIGQTGAARAVGRANATNPICVLIPCHRVIGANGSLTGFAFGEACKRRLLAIEGARLPPGAR